MRRDAQSCFWPRVLIQVRAAAVLHDPDSMAHIARQHGAVCRMPDTRQLLVDVTHRQEHAGSPLQLAARLRRQLGREMPGNGFHLGVAHEPMLAACAAALAKAAAPAVIVPWEAKERVRALPVEVLSAGYPRLARLMATVGLQRCGQIADIAPGIVQRLFGDDGVHLRRLCRQGHGGTEVEIDTVPGRISCRAVLPPQTRGRRALQSHLRRLCLEANRTLRRHQRLARTVGLRAWTDDGNGFNTVTLPALDFAAPRRVPEATVGRLHELCRGRACLMLQMELTDLQTHGPQLELFADEEVNSTGPLCYSPAPPVEKSVRTR